jgi:hypothetical protein
MSDDDQDNQPLPPEPPRSPPTQTGAHAQEDILYTTLYTNTMPDAYMEWGYAQAQADPHSPQTAGFLCMMAGKVRVCACVCLCIYVLFNIYLEYYSHVWIKFDPPTQGIHTDLQMLKPRSLIHLPSHSYQ